MERPATSPRDISSRSLRDRANRDTPRHHGKNERVSTVRAGYDMAPALKLRKAILKFLNFRTQDKLTMFQNGRNSGVNLLGDT